MRFRLALFLAIGLLAPWIAWAGAGISSHITLTNGSSAAVAPANRARLRYHLGNNRLEVSYNGGAYAALSGGGGGSTTLQQAYEASSNPVRITEDNTRSTLIVRANSNGDNPLKIENNAGAALAIFSSTGDLTITNYLYPAGINGTYSTMARRISSGSAPSCAVGTNAMTGGSPSCTATGSAEVFRVSLTTGTNSNVTFATVFTLTHAGGYAYPNGANLSCRPADQATANAESQFVTNRQQVYTCPNTTTCTFSTATTSGYAASTTYLYDCEIRGR